MNMYRLILLLFISGLATSCNLQSESGGQCSYVNFEEVAEILSVSEAKITANGVDLDYEFESNISENLPTVGERYLIKSQRLTNGSCAPLRVVSIEKQ